jgi:hypothetical protein
VDVNGLATRDVSGLARALVELVASLDGRCSASHLQDVFKGSLNAQVSGRRRSAACDGRVLLPPPSPLQRHAHSRGRQPAMAAVLLAPGSLPLPPPLLLQVKRLGHDSLPQHGAGAELRKADIERLYRRLVSSCLLVEDTHRQDAYQTVMSVIKVGGPPDLCRAALGRPPACGAPAPYRLVGNAPAAGAAVSRHAPGAARAGAPCAPVPFAPGDAPSAPARRPPQVHRVNAQRLLQGGMCVQMQFAPGPAAAASKPRKGDGPPKKRARKGAAAPGAGAAAAADALGDDDFDAWMAEGAEQEQEAEAVDQAGPLCSAALAPPCRSFAALPLPARSPAVKR